MRTFLAVLCFTAFIGQLFFLSASGSSELKAPTEAAHPHRRYSSISRQQQRTSSYCAAPLPRYVPPEPSDAKLVQVLVVSRHGDRSPLAPLPHEGPGGENVEWLCGVSETTALTSFGGGGVGDFVLDIAPPAASPFAARFWRGNCTAGQLTLHGAEQCLALGAALRDIYVAKLGLLPEQYSPALVYARSTDLWRTKQSLMAVLQGLYPPSTRSAQVVTIHTVPWAVEVLFPNSAACPRISGVIAEAASTAEWAAHDAEMAPVVKKCNAAAGTLASADWASSGAWFDVLQARTCHGIALPCSAAACVTSEDAETIFAGVTWENNMMLSTTEGARLAGGQLVEAITAAMLEKASTGSGPRYLHFSGHDSSITALLMALRVTDRPFAPYASHFVFELWQLPGGSGFAVRALFNGDVVQAPECSTAMLCPLEDWHKMVKDRLTITNYTAECHVDEVLPDAVRYLAKSFLGGH